MIFRDRRDAGRQLAMVLGHYIGKPVVVYGLPRGGVVVAAEVAEYLKAPLDVIIARKIGHPLNPEYAIGAVAERGRPVWSEAELSLTTNTWRDEQVAAARIEARRRRKAYQGDQQPVDASGKTAIVVDDGIATGMTLSAALRELRYRHPRSIVVAAPVAPRQMPWEILRYAEAQTYILQTPENVGAVGLFYADFSPVTDEEVRQLLDAYRPLGTEPLNLPALHALLSTVHSYPVTNGELIDRAERQHAPENVVAFFESMPRDVAFEDKTDVMLRADEAELLMEEESREPDETVRDEDI